MIKKRGLIMRFGSVEFFKVLIKTVLAVAFFVPLILCVIFAVVLWNTRAELDKVKAENERLALASEILAGERTADVESYYSLYAKSGLSDDELISYIMKKNGGSVPAAATPAQEDTSAQEKEPEQGGASAQDKAPEQDAPEELPEQEPASEEAAPSESSPYAAFREDMMVSAPTEYVREEGTIYLTFDDGPSQNTYSVLAYLKKYGIKATFFVVPSRTDSCYEIMRQIVSEGHSIGVHSASHEYNTIYSSVDAYLEDFAQAWDIIYDATGVKTEIFRFPGGSKNDFNGATRNAIIAEMTRRGFRHYDWNVDSNDAGGADWTAMYNSIPTDIGKNKRSIVLMHDSSPRTNTVWVLEDVIKVLVNEGWKFDKINNDTMPIQFTGPFA